MAAESAIGTANSDTEYVPEPGWAKLPHGIWFKDATSVAVDSDDRVYVFNRGNMPVLIFDPDGNLVDMWGNDNPYAPATIMTDNYGNSDYAWEDSRFKVPHAIRIDHEDNLWLVDGPSHQILKTDKKGKVLMTLGSGERAPRHSGKIFAQPTDVAISEKTGEIFVSDGYHNSHVHRFSHDGKHIGTWGGPGTDPGKFNLPHSICMLGDDKVLVGDRENWRVQIFTTDGKFVEQWHIHHPLGTTAGRGRDTNIYIAENGPNDATQDGVPNLGHCVSIHDREGRRVNRIGDSLPGGLPNQFASPHFVAVDSRGDIYVAEVSYMSFGSHADIPHELVSLCKWRRVAG